MWPVRVGASTSSRCSVVRACRILLQQIDSQIFITRPTLLLLQRSKKPRSAPQEPGPGRYHSSQMLRGLSHALQLLWLLLDLHLEQGLFQLLRSRRLSLRALPGRTSLVGAVVRRSGMQP